jgi:hypothetical protein
MSRTAAFRFLCDCLSRDCSPAVQDGLLRAAQSQSFDWETFIQVASEKFVAPSVLGALRNKGILSAAPQPVTDFFEAITFLNRERNEQLLQQAAELALNLNKIGVIPVFLKGSAHLLCGLYPDPGERMMIDLDVLVPDDRLSECVQHLRADGFVELLTNWNFSGHHHYPPLGRPGAIAAVELHREPIDAPYRGLLTSKEVFDDAIVVEKAGAKLAVPSARCRIIHAVAHAQLADQNYFLGRLPLRELLDFAHLHNTHGQVIDWGEFAKRFANCRAALEFHLLAAERLLNVPIHPSVRISWAAKAFYQRAVWQIDHPGWSRFSTRLLRPYLLLRRSLSDAALRRRLLRNLGDRAWYRRQWRMLR